MDSTPHQLDDDLLAYALTCSSPEDAILSDLRTRTWQTALTPQMLSDPIQGRLLQNWSRMLRPRRILELGTYTGYATICLAAGMTDDGEIVTIEPNDELNAVQDEFWERAGIRDRITRHNQEAGHVLSSLEGPFDLVWIDADKPRTPAYVELCLALVREGGWVLVDNVLWWGKVLPSASNQDETAQILHAMNRDLAKRHDLRTSLIPVRDGILMIEKLARSEEAG